MKRTIKQPNQANSLSRVIKSKLQRLQHSVNGTTLWTRELGQDKVRAPPPFSMIKLPRLYPISQMADTRVMGHL